MRNRFTTQKLARLGLLAALGVLFTLFRFFLFPAVSFLEMEFADVPILIGTLLYGTPAGLALTLVVSVLQGLLISPDSGVYGILMHCAATGTLVTVSGLMLRVLGQRNSNKSEIGRPALAVALGCGAVSMCVVMFGANMVITPLFTGWPLSAVMDVMPWILLFNLTKAGINSAIAWVLYKYAAAVLRT